MFSCSNMQPFPFFLSGDGYWIGLHDRSVEAGRSHTILFCDSKVLYDFKQELTISY